MQEQRHPGSPKRIRVACSGLGSEVATLMRSRLRKKDKNRLELVLLAESDANNRAWLNALETYFGTYFFSAKGAQGFGRLGKHHVGRVDCAEVTSGIPGQTLGM